MKLNIENNSNKNSGFVCGMIRKIAELLLLAFGISLIVFCYLFDLSEWRSEIAIFLIPPALVMTDYLRKILRGSIYSWFKVWETGIKIFLSSSVMIYFFGVIGGWQSDASSVLLIASFMALLGMYLPELINLCKLRLNSSGLLSFGRESTLDWSWHGCSVQFGCTSELSWALRYSRFVVFLWIISQASIPPKAINSTGL